MTDTKTTPSVGAIKTVQFLDTARQSLRECAALIDTHAVAPVAAQRDNAVDALRVADATLFALRDVTEYAGVIDAARDIIASAIKEAGGE